MRLYEIAEMCEIAHKIALSAMLRRSEDIERAAKEWVSRGLRLSRICEINYSYDPIKWKLSYMKRASKNKHINFKIKEIYEAIRISRDAE